jgi:asparagine synthase (glutamine-hydrolysing)
VLDGFDGDTTLSHGLGYLSELAMTGRWLKLARTSIPYSRRRGRPVVSSYLELVRFGLRHPSRDTAAGSLAQRLRRRKREGARRDRAPLNRHRVLNADFARRFEECVEAKPHPATTERELHLRRLNAPVLFETVGWLEACAAGRGVDVRLPFCDVRLAELCLSFPPDQKIRRGWTRFAMRRAMEGILPRSIQWRKGKTGLHAGWASAWRSTQDGRIEAMLARPSPAVTRYLDPERVLELHRRFLREEPDDGEGRALRRALSLALWLSSRDTADQRREGVPEVDQGQI